MNHDDLRFLQIMVNQEPNLHDQILHQFRTIKAHVDYMFTWIEDFHNEDVYESEEEKVQLLATLAKINAIWEEEIQ